MYRISKVLQTFYTRPCCFFTTIIICIIYVNVKKKNLDQNNPI